MGHQVLQVVVKNLLGNEKVTKSLHTNQEPVLGEGQIRPKTRGKRVDLFKGVPGTHAL